MKSISRATIVALLQVVLGTLLVLSLGVSSVSGMNLSGEVEAVWQTTADELPFDVATEPVFLIASYYNAINLGDYARAYAYWNGNEPGGATLAEFTQGFADTESVEGWAVLPLATEGAAGSVYSEVPVLLRATQTNGDEQLFAGCITTRRSNVPVGDATEPDPNWHLFDGTFQGIDSLDPDEATARCERTETFPLSSPFDNALQPIDLLISYYDAVSRGDYFRAYSYWSGQPRNQTLEQFVDGFVGTDNIGLIVGLNFQADAAAGSVYASLPTAITATYNGVAQYFEGCFVARRSNVPVGDATEPDPNWRFFDADLAVVGGLQEGLDMSAQGCTL